jgi:hypothetical protein
MVRRVRLNLASEEQNSYLNSIYSDGSFSGPCIMNALFGDVWPLDFRDTLTGAYS